MNVSTTSAFRRPGLLWAVLFAGFGTALTPTVADAAVELLVDPNGGAPFSTLSGAVAAAPPGAVIRLRTGTYHETIVIDKNLTLVGPNVEPGAVLDGEHRRALIRVVNSAVLRCENIVLCNGLSDGGAAATVAAGAVADFINCTFHNNRARGSGGAVALGGIGSWAEFLGCHFQHNRATDSGGAVAVTPGAELTLRQCVFFANSAGGPCGGVDTASASPVVVEHCLFIENQGSVCGALHCTDGELQLDGNTFFRNTSLGGATVQVAADSTHPVTIVRNIFCGDLEGAGLQGPEHASRDCNLYFDNFRGPVLGGERRANEFVANPEFCDFRGLDLTLRRNSPASGISNDCGRIGALDVGCLESLEASGWTSPVAPRRLVH